MCFLPFAMFSTAWKTEMRSASRLRQARLDNSWRWLTQKGKIWQTNSQIYINLLFPKLCPNQLIWKFTHFPRVNATLLQCYRITYIVYVPIYHQVRAKGFRILKISIRRRCPMYPFVIMLLLPIVQWFFNKWTCTHLSNCVSQCII